MRSTYYLRKDPQIYDATLKTGRQKNLKERMSYSFKEKTTFPKTKNSDDKSHPNITTSSLQDTLEKSKLLMLSKNIIGGQECEPSSKIMSKDAEFANNSR